MDSVRKRLLYLYHCILATPDFQKAFEWTDKNLQPFDRQAYVNCLLTQYPTVPEEFRMWILEWPTRLVVQCTWPGLPFINCRAISLIDRRSGVDWVAYRSFSSQLSALVHKLDRPSQTFILGLLIWRVSETGWLIFEQDKPYFSGRVFRTHTDYHTTGSIPYYPRRENHDFDEDASSHSDYAPSKQIEDDLDEDTDSNFSDGEECLVIYDDWISYLESLWTETADAILHPPKSIRLSDTPVPPPVLHLFDGGGETIFPANAWVSSQRSLDRPHYIFINSP